MDTSAQDIISHHLELSEVLAYLEKQKEPEKSADEDGDFTIYHPLKNGDGKYQCIPYSFFGSMTSFSDDRDLMNFLRSCFYTEEECEEWIETQKEELSTRLNGLMQEYVKAGKDEEEQEHRLKCYQLFWDALGDSEFFKQKEQKPTEGDFPYNTPADTVEGEIENIWSKVSCDNIFIETKKGFREVILHFVNYVRSKAATEWSEEEKRKLNRIYAILGQAADTHAFSTTCRLIGDKEAVELQDFLRSIAKPKSGEWSEDDEGELQVAAHRLASHGYPEDAEWLKSLPNRFNLPPKQEWSEKDEKMLNDTLNSLKRYQLSMPNFQVELQMRWLKSLRPQPKAELTLLDENIIKAAIAFVEQNDHFNCSGGIDKQTVIKALRSLKPHWKPSEEQMKALEDAKMRMSLEGYGLCPLLQTLINDLKSL